MELRHLQAFRAVAATASVTRAAATLNYVQSAVSAQIQALEAELGTPLFDRLGRRMVLTDAGRQLLPYAERMLDLAAEARGVIGNGTTPRGTLTIGASETLCACRLPVILRRFRERCPEVQLRMQAHSGADLLAGLRSGAIDLAFALDEPIAAPDLEVHLLRREPLAIVAAPDHPLRDAPGLQPADLSATTLLLTEAGCAYRALFTRVLSSAGVRPENSLEFGSIEAIKQCVAAGVGIAVLPEVAVATEIAGGTLIALPWSGDGLAVATQMIRHRERWLSPAVSMVMEIATDELLEPPAR